MIFSKPFRTDRDYACKVRTISLEPAIRLLKDTDPRPKLAGITLNGPFQQIQNWGASMTYLARPDNPLDDGGLSQVEAFPVYEICDTVFREVFPSHTGLSRPEAAAYVNSLIQGLCLGMLGKDEEPAGARQHLLVFFEQLSQALEWYERKPVPHAVA
jgi:hypothetical protein